MDTEAARKSLGETGLLGVAAIAVGIALVARENRRAAVGTLAVLVGTALVGHGLVGSFLESMGMSYDDL